MNMFSRMRTAISRQLTPSRTFILSLAVVILIGAVLLRMPGRGLLPRPLASGVFAQLLPSFFSLICPVSLMKVFMIGRS